MNYYHIKFQDKIFKNVEVVEKNVNRLIVFGHPLDQDTDKNFRLY